MFDPVPLPEAARDERRVVHELQVGAALHQALREQIPAAVIGCREHDQVERGEPSEDTQGDPEIIGEWRPQRREPGPDQIKKKGQGGGRDDHRQRRKPEEHARGRRKVTAPGERATVPFVPLVA